MTHPHTSAHTAAERKRDKDKASLDAMLPWSREYRQYEKEQIEANRHLLDNLFPAPERPKASSKNSEAPDLQSDADIA